MKEEKLGLMRMNVNGLRDTANAMETIYPKDVIIKMPIWKGDDGLYMQLDKGTGFINLVKNKQEIKSVLKNCPECGGSGVWVNDERGNEYAHPVKCEDCDGTGKIKMR